MTKTRIQHALIILLVVVVCIGLTSCQMILRGMQALVDPDANESAETDIVPTRTPPEPIEPLLTEVIVPPEPTTVPGTYVNNNPDIHTQMTLGGHTYEFNLPPETTFDFNELYGGSTSKASPLISMSWIFRLWRGRPLFRSSASP
jgi:hypothetical protein